MVAVATKRRWAAGAAGSPSSSTARLLLLGHKQVGKSAAIVRFTTGRFIEDYCQATGDWLYKHSLGFDPDRNLFERCELLEQRDLDFGPTAAAPAKSSAPATGIARLQEQQASLAARVARDQLSDAHLFERQQLLRKLRWADAYVVVYSIAEVSSFNKAIKYLNLIANCINAPPTSCSCSTARSKLSPSGLASCLAASSAVSPSQQPAATCGACNGSSASSLNNSSSSLSHSSSSNSSPSSLQSPQLSAVVSATATTSPSASSNRRPILLLANKTDLEPAGRQVSLRDGRLLAMRHRTLFAEVSAAQSSRQIERALLALIDQIQPTDLHYEPLADCHPAQGPLPVSQLEQWSAPRADWLGLAAQTAVLVQSSRLSVSARLQEADVGLLTPVGPQLAKPLEAAAKDSAQLKPLALVAQVATAETQLVAQPMMAVARPLRATNRMDSLKSSFRKASMAIVSSRTLARRAKVATDRVMGPKKGCPALGEPLPATPIGTETCRRSATQPRASWLRGHIQRLGRSQVVAAESHPSEVVKEEEQEQEEQEEEEVAREPQQQQVATSRFRRPLFKYKNRNKTVAFERISAQTPTVLDSDAGGQLVSSLSISGPDSVPGPAAFSIEPPTGGCVGAGCERGRQGHNQSRCQSGHSSSSLSVGDTYCSSLFLVSQQPIRPPVERAPSGAGSASLRSASLSSASLSWGPKAAPSATNSRWLVRKHSRSTLSHASTSAGSCDSSSESADFVSTATLSAAASEQLQPSATGGLGFDPNGVCEQQRCNQLVRTAQSTLTSLTKSAAVATRQQQQQQQQVTKRSFCGALFRSATGCEPATRLVVSRSGQQVARAADQIRPVVSFCK